MRSLTIVLLTLCGLIMQAAPQSDLQFRHYTTDDGLTSNCIRDIIQDNDGFVWFATDGGIIRSDGLNFKPYKLECPIATMSENNYVSSLLVSDDAFYAGTDSHLYRYNKDQDRFEYIALTDKMGTPLSLNIRDMAIDKDGNLWISAIGKGIIKVKGDTSDGYDLQEYKFTKVRDIISCVYVDSRNDIWAVSNVDDQGLYRFDKSKNSFTPYHLQSKGAEISSAALTVSEDETGMMWLGTWDGRILKFDPYNGECTLMNLPPDQMLHIHTLTPVANGIMMVGSDKGLVQIDTKTGTYRCFVPDELNTASLSGQFIYPIIQDREGGIWIGTYYSGINYAPPLLKNFESYKTSKYRNNSVSGYVISSFAEDNQGNIYIASDDGGLSKYSPATGVFEHIPTNGANNLHALTFDGNRLLIGSYGAGVYSMDCRTKQLTKIQAPDSNYDEISSYAMLCDSHGRVWIASNEGLNLYDRDTNKLNLIKRLNTQIADIKESPTGEIWVSTQGEGLYVHNPQDGSWRSFTSNNQDGALPHNHVAGCDFTADGTAWIATAGGLCRSKQGSDDFVTEPKTLSGVEIFSIIEDQGALWLTTNMGLIKYTPGQEIETFTVSDGVCSSQFMPNAIFKSSNGKIYVGTRSGFNAFYPYQIKPNAVNAPVVFTALEINNAPVEVGDSHLPHALGELGELVLTSDDNSVGISFASLSFVNPLKNKYAYRLVGFDKDWIETTKSNKAFYTNLPTGDYVLEVKASNNDNVWSNTPIKLKIHVLPAWYWSWYMKVIYVLLLLSAIALIIMTFMRRAQRVHNEELMLIKNRKDTELYESKLQFFTMVAHEIRTPVSLIIAPLEKLMKQVSTLPQSMALDLTIIERNCQRLLFLVNQLLDFKKSEETGLAVSFRKCNIRNLVYNVADRFRPTLDNKNITLEVNCNIPYDFTADVDQEAVTKLLSNLVNNARKFTKDHISITVTADDAKQQIAISVADNGCGIDKNEQKKIFRPFYQVASDDNTMRGGTGLGLSIVQGVVEAHKGSIGVESELGKGTIFTAKLPIHQDNVVTEEETEAKDCTVAVAGSAEGRTSKRATMLVVDDNDELCTFIANNFSEKYHVITAENGKEALDIMAREDISIIISDWMMPQMDGVELCKHIRADKQYSHIPFVLLTAKTDNLSKVQGLNCGADAYVEKPFSVQVLEARIDNLLHMREMLRQKYSQTPLEPIESVAQHPVDNQFLTQLTKIIEDNFANNDLDVDFLASRMDMSRSGLYSKIKSLVDVTPNDLIRITRLKQAAKLLSEGKYRINEVCYMVGFNSSSYFTKCFQKQFGMTPSEFVNVK